MNTLVQSTTATISRRFDGYEPLDHHHQRIMMRDDRNQLRRRASSKRSKKLEGHRVRNSRSYRNERAKQRRIFLKTYKLAPVGNFHQTRKLDELATKVKKVVVSVLSLIRIGSGSLRSCNCRLAIRASTPNPMCRK
ncbi:hypothetical protein PanWU01x14_352760 [Parasponia andersonii]|uniref:Uncharacterized protein n=1 Tax=Parasponia andersonii TaxID=3476 RepID=A0A2P5AA62_PARAD|nr:hypothetical protein PanWU01x14_352760 [Parasponia andersonii]